MRAGKENQGRKRLITISDERRVKKTNIKLRVV